MYVFWYDHLVYSLEQIVKILEYFRCYIIVKQVYIICSTFKKTNKNNNKKTDQKINF